MLLNKWSNISLTIFGCYYTEAVKPNLRIHLPRNYLIHTNDNNVMFIRDNTVDKWKIYNRKLSGVYVNLI